MSFWSSLKRPLSIVLPCCRLRKLILVSDQFCLRPLFRITKWSLRRALIVFILFHSSFFIHIDAIFFLCNPRALFLTQNAKIVKVFLVSYTVLARHFWHKPKIKVLFKYALKHHYETPTFLGCILFLRVLKAALWTQSRPFLRSPHQFNCRPRARVFYYLIYFSLLFF